MLRSCIALAVVGIVSTTAELSAQAAPVDSTFLTGACPTLSADSVDWNAVVAEPERRAQLVPTSMPMFPPHLRQDGYRGHVVLGMLVDASGKVVEGSVVITESSDPRLSAWGCFVAASLRYRPAMSGRSAVVSMVEQPLGFRAKVMSRRLQ